jgi:hypothetical protein
VNLAGLSDVSGHALSGEVVRQWVVTPTAVVDDAGTADDAWVVRRSTDGLRIEVFRNGEALPARSFDVAESFLEFQSNGGNDSIAIESSNGNPLPGGGLLVSRGHFIVDAAGAAALGLIVNGSASVRLASGGAFSMVSVRDTAQLKAASGSVVRAGSLSIDAAARFDLDSGSLILAVEASGDHGAGQTKAVSDWVASALRGGGNAWDGAGLTSSAAKADAGGFTTLAVFNNDDGSGNALLSELGGRSVGANCILVKYTWNGDANLDGRVNADDYFVADSGYITQKGGWCNGDFNYDGVMNADDYFLIDSAFVGQQGLLSAGTAVDGAMGRAAELPTPVQTQQRKDQPITVLAELFSTTPIL